MNNNSFFELQKQPNLKIATLFLNNPDKRNAMDSRFWSELPQIITEIENDSSIHAVVIAAKGKSFSLGLDLLEFSEKNSQKIQGNSAESREKLYELILYMQEGFKRIHNGKKVYIAAVHRHCIGGGLDMIAACDIRLSTNDALFSLRETVVAIVADLSSLNLLPGIIGQGNTRLLAFTGQDFSATEAKEMGLINRIYPNYDTLLQEAEKLAAQIAANPNMAVRGTKEILNYMESHSPAEGLNYVATWNSAFLLSEDFHSMLKKFQERKQRQ